MRELIENQYENTFLWTPILMAFGAALYFSLPDEPHILLIAAAAMALVVCIVRRASYPMRGIGIFIFGFVYAAMFTAAINTPVMPHDMHNKTIKATVESIEYTPTRARIYMTTDSAEIDVLPPRNATVRVSAPIDGAIPNVGDTVRADVGLFVPGGPDAPGAFDFARWAYYNRISATGYMSQCEIVTPARGIASNSIRDRIHERADSFLTDALVLGYKNALTPDERTVWTSAGIAHVWSISGFHMTLVAGWLFAVFYTIFRCVPYITRRVPARAVALCAAWAGLAMYMMIAGTGIATMRAFAMTTLVFAAFLFGRNAISMRNICIAFCIIFMINPHYVMQPGFQLSFAAVFGLIWFWGSDARKTPHSKILKIIYVAAMTSIIATIFTAPFVAAHFYSFQVYGLIGNLILLPIFSFLIMPLVIIGTITAIIGFAAPLNVAETVYDFTLRVATAIAEMPMANITMPHISNTAMVMIIMAFACLIFVRPTHRKENVALFGAWMFAAICVVATTPRPVFYATDDHELVAFVDNGEIEFNKSRASNHTFTFDTWKQINAIPTGTDNRRRKCVRGVCMFETDNFTVAYIQRFVPLAREIDTLCADDKVNYIVSYFDVRAPRCEHKILRGGFVIYKSGRVKYTATHRRWHNRPE